eukprot:sb/3462986/
MLPRRESLKYVKSEEYGGTGGGRNTHFLLVCEVVTGHPYATHQECVGLSAPPAGYDSVVSVPVSKIADSCFQSEEICVFDPTRVRVTGLLEFPKYPSVTPDFNTPHVNPGVDDEDKKKEKDEEGSWEEVVDIQERVEERVEMQEQKIGLVAGGCSVPVTDINVLATVTDMVGEVTLFQTFASECEDEREAKYVFPLTEGAAAWFVTTPPAVCGFEAFIGDKHIVGELKRKEQARKEYREAVAAGHGAYLMEQEKPCGSVLGHTLNSPKFVDLKSEQSRCRLILPPLSRLVALALATSVDITTHVMRRQYPFSYCRILPENDKQPAGQLTSGRRMSHRNITTYIGISYMKIERGVRRVCHKRLLEKLANAGIGGKLLAWIESFLVGRSQAVVVDGVKSRVAAVKSGVPQGTVLAPLLFLLYVDDMADVLQHSTMKLFADDAKVKKSIKTEEDRSLLLDDMGRINQWAIENSMELNTQKRNSTSGGGAAFIHCFSGCEEMSYWQRLHHLGLYSLQRRRERYKILYLWKLYHGLLPNHLNLVFKSSIRRGPYVERPLGKSKLKSINSKIFNSCSSTAVSLFNAVPKIVKEQQTLEGAKRELDKFLSNIPDEPPLKGNVVDSGILATGAEPGHR